MAFNFDSFWLFWLAAAESTAALPSDEFSSEFSDLTSSLDEFVSSELTSSPGSEFDPDDPEDPVVEFDCSLLSLTTPFLLPSGLTAALEMPELSLVAAGAVDMGMGKEVVDDDDDAFFFFFFLEPTSPPELARLVPGSVLFSVEDADDVETGRSELGGVLFPEPVSSLDVIAVLPGNGSDPVPPSPEPLLGELLNVEPIGRSAGCE
jgi:hypothetical protein